MACLIIMVVKPGVLTGFFIAKVAFFHVYHLFWLVVVLILFKRMIPGLNPKIASGKVFRRHYGPGKKRGPAIEEKLASYAGRMNRGALKTAGCWTLVVLATGLLYSLGAFGPPGLFMVVLFFVFMDQFCVTVWCPFEWIIGNKCCASCRINNWGYLMAFAPLVFLPSFWTLSVVGLSAAVVVQWEYLCRAHSERLFELTNESLTCVSCKDRCARVERRFSH